MKLYKLIYNFNKFLKIRKLEYYINQINHFLVLSSINFLASVIFYFNNSYFSKDSIISVTLKTLKSTSIPVIFF